MRCAQVPCAHAVSLAKAAVDEDLTAADPMLIRLANVSTSDAESGAHAVFREAWLTAPVPISTANLGEDPAVRKWPYVKFSDWMRLLIDTGRLPRQLCGVRTVAEMRQRLRVFWFRFQALHPTHEVFVRATHGQIDLSRAVPVWSHTDEGRTQKKLALLVLSVHGCLGRGTKQYLDDIQRDPDKRDGMGLNFIGPSWGTQFLFSVMMRGVWQKYPQALDKLVELFADDLSRCALEGVASTRNPNEIFFAVQLGTKGDLPALIKLGGFKRTYNRVPKTARSNTLCRGICHLCDAGREGDFPVFFEDLSSEPGWLGTAFINPPWDTEPTMLRGQLLEPGKPSFFFRLDLWHCFHCGVARVWLASAFIVLCNLGVIVGGSVDARFRSLTESYREFCARHRFAMHIQEFTRDNLGFDSEASWPVGKWNKGAASTHMMLFLENFMEDRVVGRTDDVLLLAIVTCRCCVQECFMVHVC